MRTLTRSVSQIIVNAIALLAAALVVPGIEFRGAPADPILLGVIVGLVNALVKARTLPLLPRRHARPVQPGGGAADVLPDRAPVTRLPRPTA